MLSEPKQQNDAEPDRYTFTYRAAESSQVMSWIKAGQSGCIIGLRGAGKSNFLRFLLRDDVQQHYLGQTYNDFAFVFVDLLALAGHTEWAVYELLLNRLADQLHMTGLAPQAIKEITALHREVTKTKDLLTAQRAVERCMDVLCQRADQHVTLVLDEFDAVFRMLDPSLFRSLRAIRDAHKGQISYLVVVTDELTQLRDDLIEVEHFCRLVSRNICGLGPYNESDARQMINYLVTQRSLELSTQGVARLIELSGGHAGLLKTILGPHGNMCQENNLTLATSSLIDDPAVQAECKKVWDSLSENEQIALRTLASGTRPTDSNILQRLKLKHLIHQGGADALILFAPLFTDFVHQQIPPSKNRVSIDRAHGIALVDGQSVDLTELEFEMLCYLFDRRGRVCTKDELIANVYHQQYGRMEGGIDDARLQTLISRLRAKVEAPRCILTVRGEGYKFIEPSEP